MRLGYSAGEAIGPDIFKFYRGIGFNLQQLYGMTDSGMFVTVQPNGEIKSDTVGKPAYEVDIKIAENGDVMFKSPGIFQEYLKTRLHLRERSRRARRRSERPARERGCEGILPWYFRR